MKRILILTAFLIFACSGDDSSDTNNSSNHTFLERYDGVVWEVDNYEINPYYGRYIIFYNSQQIYMKEFFSDGCDLYFLGYSSEFNRTVYISVNNQNEFSLTIERDGAEDYVSFIVDENNILTANSTANSDYNNLSYLKTTLADPCE